MTATPPFDPEAVIDAIAPLLDLPVAPAWRPGVAANLAITGGFAAIVMAVELPDEADPAPVFTP